MHQKTWYDLQFLRYRVWKTEIGNYGSFFAFLLPPKNQKNQNFEKMKKIAADIIILHMFTKNHNHTRYGSWDTEWDRQNFLLFLTTSWSFAPLTTRKIKILKKWEKHLEVPSFYTCVPKLAIIWFMLPETWSATDITICHFGRFFALLSHYLTPKIKIWKKCKKNLVILSFSTCAPKMKIVCRMVPEINDTTEFFVT